jgi:hypothetical protein
MIKSKISDLDLVKILFIFVPCHREQLNASRSMETHLKLTDGACSRSRETLHSQARVTSSGQLKMAGLPLCSSLVELLDSGMHLAVSAGTVANQLVATRKLRRQAAVRSQVCTATARQTAAV